MHGSKPREWTIEHDQAVPPLPEARPAMPGQTLPAGLYFIWIDPRISANSHIRSKKILAGNLRIENCKIDQEKHSNPEKTTNDKPLNHKTKKDQLSAPPLGIVGSGDLYTFPRTELTSLLELDFFSRRLVFWVGEHRDTIDGICNLIAHRAPTLRLLGIEWFGGEPLLELPIIEEVQGFVSTVAAGHPQLRTGGSMTTNGYFLEPDVLSRLVDLGVYWYQISIDGDAASHDSRRCRGDGGGTFERIWSNVLAARDSEIEFRFRLRTHVDKTNCRSIPEYLRRLASEAGGDERFEVFLRPVSRLGGPNDKNLPVLDATDGDVIDDLRALAESLGLRLFRSEDSDVCHAAAANSFVIRSTGDIAKCTMALRHPNNKIGKLHSDGKATIDNELFQGWIRGLISGDSEELSCPMKGFADPREPMLRSELAILAAA